ncbi:MAG: oligosaccharide flippase family protein [Verrucomicrobiae bacterium]|nr:oligosaccharide flippase family protein [Verrucomicrobiae bacterium]
MNAPASSAPGKSARKRPVRERLADAFEGTSGHSRLARAVSWNVLGGAAARLLSLGAMFVVARILGRPVFGQLGMIQYTFLTMGVFASFGLGITATRFVSLYRPTAPERAGRVAAMATTGAGVLATLGALGVLLAAPWLALAALDNVAFAPLVRLAAPMLVLGALQDASQGVLAGLESFRALARVAALTGAAQAAGMVAGAYAGGLSGCLVGLMVGMAAGYLATRLTLNAELVRAGLNPSWNGWRLEVPSLLRFAVPAMLAGGVVIPADWLVRAILTHQPSGEDQAGLFYAAHSIRMMILYVPGLVATAGLPVLTHLWGHTSGNEYLRVLRMKLAIGFAVASLVAVPAIVGAPWIMAAFGKGFAEGAPALRVLACAAVITATLNMIGQSLVSEGRMWTGLLLNIIWATVLISLSLWWIPRQGALGLAWANLAAFGVHLVTVSWYVFWRSRERRSAG